MMYRGTIPAAAAACGFAILAFSVAPSAADDPAAVLAKHKAYMGWSYGDGTLKTVRSTREAAPSAATPQPGATPDPLGEPNAKQVVARRELLYRSESTLYGTAVGSNGFTGSVFWNANVNGQTVTVRGREARGNLSVDLIDAEAIGEAPLVARPDAQFDGKSAAVVRMEPKTGLPTDLYFDRGTGALLGYTMQPDVPLDKRTVHFVSYAEFVPGKRYVSEIRVGDSRRVFRVTKFEANAAVSDADLHPPTTKPHWSFGEPRSIPITIAEHGNGYTNTGNRAVHVSVAVNGKLGTFLLDTGSFGTIIFDPFAQAAGIKDFARSAFSGVNGRDVRAALARVDALTIGGNTLHDVIVTHGSHGGAGLDGIVGFDALAGAVFTIDLPKQQLTISDPNGYDIEPKPGAWAFTPDLSSFHIGIPVKVGSAVLSNVWLDTGDDGFVILPHELEKSTVALQNEISLRSGQTFADKHYFGGADGSGAEPAKCVRLNEVQIGPYRYQGALSCFAPNDAFGLDGGLVGFDFLKHFNWVFDYPHNRVVLSPNGM